MEFETRVEEILRRTDDVKSFRFTRPHGFDFDPGQYIYITISIGGEKKEKHFSISSSPTENFLEMTKKITDHEFSRALDKLQIGDEVVIDGPYGEFTFTGEYPKIGMITGGIGITPLKSILTYCTDTGITTQITLLYGNRSEETIAFREELNSLEQQNKNLRVIHTLSRPGADWKGRRGHVDLAMIKEEIPDYADRVFYVCGPPALVEDLVNALVTLGVPAENINMEDFPGY
ncbi:MAG: xylene monooxygenase [Methanomicrobia archaeon]|nr:xylene monooxygenase [Methanomicrobia archaeon]